MPTKKFGGGCKRRRGKRNGRSKTYSLDDLVPSVEDNQVYAYVTLKYGDGRYEIMCYDKVTRLGLLRGSLKKNSRIDKGGLILVSLRDYQDDRCDIIYQYKPDDIEKLQKANKINPIFVKSGKLSCDDDTGNITQTNMSTLHNMDNISIGSNESNGLDTESLNSNDATIVNEHSKQIIEDIKDDFDEFNIDDL
jgi:translation initiation factor 1A